MRNGKSRETLRQRTQDGYAGALRQVQRANNRCGADDGNQYRRNALAVLKQKDHNKRADTDRERAPVRSASENRGRDSP